MTEGQKMKKATRGFLLRPVLPLLSAIIKKSEGRYIECVSETWNYVKEFCPKASPEKAIYHSDPKIEALTGKLAVTLVDIRRSVSANLGEEGTYVQAAQKPKRAQTKRLRTLQPQLAAILGVSKAGYLESIMETWKYVKANCRRLENGRYECNDLTKALTNMDSVKYTDIFKSVPKAMVIDDKFRLSDMSPELTAIVGTDVKNRKHILSKLHDYVRAHNLRLPEKNTVRVDSVLKTLFGDIETINFYEVQSKLEPHWFYQGRRGKHLLTKADTERRAANRKEKQEERRLLKELRLKRKENRKKPDKTLE